MFTECGAAVGPVGAHKKRTGKLEGQELSYIRPIIAMDSNSKLFWIRTEMLRVPS